MTSFQSTLGDEPGIAEELAESQQAISIAEFFEKNKHMLGFDSGARGLVTAVKEAVDNALDAAEEAGILPDIYVEIQEAGDYYRLIVEDNGPGLTKESLPKVFGKLLYGSRFHAREQSRGQQGIGISAAVLYAQLTSGKPAKITSRTEGSSEAQYFELIVDTDDNEPEISVEETTTWDRPHGTRIELEMEANMRARQQLHDYIKHTAVVNPHARLELREPQAHFKFERATDQLPEETEEIRPHPHGVELGTVMKMLTATDSQTVSGFLQEEFTRVGKKTADSIIDAFRDRHYGREMRWRSPAAHEDVDLHAAVSDATANKGADATAAFAEAIADEVDDHDRIAHHELLAVVDTAAEAVEEDHGTTFGDTVRENAVDAVWLELIDAVPESEEADAEDDSAESRLVDDMYALADEATSTRKDDEVVRAFSERLAGRFADATDEDVRHRFTRDTVRESVDRAAELTEEYDDVAFGDTARENVVEAIWDVMVTVPDDPPLVRELENDRDATSDLVDSMRATDIMAPPTRCLAPISAELVEAGLEKEFDADFYASATRDAEVHGGDPFIVEAGIAYGGELQAEGSADVMRFANRVPLVYQRGACATTDVVKSIGWRNYGLDQPGGSGLPNGPAVIMVHVASTNVPFTSESKDAVANVPEIEDEIELAIREAARDLKSYLNKRRSMQKRRKKQNVLGKILPEMAEKVAEVTAREEPDIGDALARIMNNVLVERQVEADGDGKSVSVVVENNSSTNESLEVTDIVSAEPTSLSDGATVVEMDGEWFVKWEPDVDSGDESTLEYEVADDASFDLDVKGVESEKLTVSA
ncbi:DNA topoisomerase VI subunit B [Natronobacterium gregoryi]|uniref:Type 2 DNA topoisomerase 6 subunit B n=2 Tax=Natronobacterium gregoryi TaxID=44930 RepID=L0AF28_NATGS|nr:DNA topoisomerase VI subunit B [Natronobacterium gregoryi]AFZ71645.1 DNA topoisomerase VI, B subunit [Natronobacterium gregoryi SP2]ELY66264.1 DNA topoisomerase VI subunit B [Natronobacterium gregoryi SP2]PLK18759.1 DNA topoisomerase VI subunit B [Natronobacterium gregoryi SP2]SFJ65356.1 DNA topoisomerase-6 subunit B [Natronobacterium gregoryi]